VLFLSVHQNNNVLINVSKKGTHFLRLLTSDELIGSCQALMQSRHLIILL